MGLSISVSRLFLVLLSVEPPTDNTGAEVVGSFLILLLLMFVIFVGDGLGAT